MSTLTQLFTSIANTIRAKKGTTALIEAEDFPTEIAGITTGVLTPQEYEEAVNLSEQILGTALPYIELEYIESTGTQYIETGISGGTNASYELWFNPLTTYVGNFEQYFAGDSYSPIPKIFRNRVAIAGRDVVIAQTSNSGEIIVDDSGDSLFKLKYDNDGKLYYNNSFLHQYTAGNGWGNLTWWLFRSHGESNLYSSMKLYKLKMYVDNELVRDFIPVKRVSDNAICLFDRISYTFFPNQGSGTFTAGPEVEGGV